MYLNRGTIVFCLFRNPKFIYFLYFQKSKMAELKLTKPAPEFRGTAVVDGEFKDISLAEYRGKYTVLFFYPADL